MTEDENLGRRVTVATWNLDHWRRTVQVREDAWSYLRSGLSADIALLQECVPPKRFPSSRIVYREMAGRRPWGSAVATFGDGLSVEEIRAVRTRYSSHRFSMLGTYPGAVIVARVQLPGVGPLTCVSVYGTINHGYAQTTMLRIVADLIPLFDSPHGDRVILGGDLNVTTAAHPSTPELPRYEAILRAVESLGLKNLAETAAEGPSPFDGCPCNAPACDHVPTYRGAGGGSGTQLDWLFATPELARRCRTFRAAGVETPELSDHAPLVAEFEIPPDLPSRTWDPESFVPEVATAAGPAAGRVAEEIVAWSERKHRELRRRGLVHARLDRLPTSTGRDPELWVQLDLTRPEALAYTVSMTARGRLIVQFQHMRLPPFDTEDGRRTLLAELTALPGVELEARLNGRPWFPLEALAEGDNLEDFLRILDGAVEQIVDGHLRAAATPDVGGSG